MDVKHQNDAIRRKASNGIAPIRVDKVPKEGVLVKMQDTETNRLIKPI